MHKIYRSLYLCYRSFWGWVGSFIYIFFILLFIYCFLRHFPSWPYKVPPLVQVPKQSCYKPILVHVGAQQGRGCLGGSGGTLILVGDLFGMLGVPPTSLKPSLTKSRHHLPIPKYIGMWEPQGWFAQLWEWVLVLHSF